MRYVYNLLLLVSIALNCKANTPVSLRVSGESGTIPSLTPPSFQYTATLEGAIADSYEWTISGDVDSHPNGNTATIPFTSGAPNDGDLPSAIIKCKAKYKDANNNPKSKESNIIIVKWKTGHLSARIEGESFVLRESEHSYKAMVDTDLPGTITYSWTWYEDGIKKTSQSESITINFQNLINNIITLNCGISVGNTPKDASPFNINISDDNYILTVSRKDYKVKKINKTFTHYRTYTGDEAVYVHFNVDDDDFSASKDKEDKYGFDCDQDEFKHKNNRTYLDDDLCEIEINIITKDGIQIDTANNPISITAPDSLRLWKTQERKNGEILVPAGETITWNNSNEILGNILYVEGMAYDSEGTLVIQIGDKVRKLLYKTCSAGDKGVQPTIQEKEDIKTRFPNLIDCEWGVLRKGVNFFYNCLAFSVDPYLKTFRGVDYDNDSLRNYMSTLNHGIENGYPFYVYKCSKVKESLPTLSEDNFYIELSIGVRRNIFDFFRHTYMINVNPTLFTNQYNFTYRKYPADYYDIVLTSNSEGFKKRINEVINYMSCNYYVPCKLIYLIYMSDFGSVFVEGELKVENIDAFFGSDLWKENNNNLNLAPCGKSDPARKVIYYSKCHSARRASTLDKDEYKEPKNIPLDWIVFASKTGNCEVLLHLEDQLAGFEKEEFGNIIKAYK